MEAIRMRLAHKVLWKSSCNKLHLICVEQNEKKERLIHHLFLAEYPWKFCACCCEFSSTFLPLYLEHDVHMLIHFANIILMLELWKLGMELSNLSCRQWLCNHCHPFLHIGSYKLPL